MIYSRLDSAIATDRIMQCDNATEVHLDQKTSDSFRDEMSLANCKETVTPLTSSVVPTYPRLPPETITEETVMQSATAAFQRRRLGTADTPVIRNYPLNCGKVFETSPKSDCDDASLVSSLSNDDSQIGPTEGTELSGMHSPLPHEVVIPETGQVPGRLCRMPPPAPPILRSASFYTQAPHVRTVLPSPQIPRPTFGRNQSCPTTTMDFSIFGSSKASTTLPSMYSHDTTPPAAILLNGEATDASYRSGMIDSIVTHNSQLLGQRPRRHHRSKSIASASIGSSLTTAPTATSTISGTTASSRVTQYLRESPVRKEFKYMLNCISSPIRKIPLKRQDSVRLQRSKGCLT